MKYSLIPSLVYLCLILYHRRRKSSRTFNHRNAKERGAALFGRVPSLMRGAIKGRPRPVRVYRRLQACRYNFRLRRTASAWAYYCPCKPFCPLLACLRTRRALCARFRGALGAARLRFRLSAAILRFCLALLTRLTGFLHVSHLFSPYSLSNGKGISTNPCFALHSGHSFHASFVAAR